MEVRCDRCQSICNLEDTQASAGSVQCSDCGHIIMIAPSGQPTPPPEGPVTPPPDNLRWVVETVHGRSLSGPDVATLHRWIIERRVTREDRISLNGQGWQRIGDVAELAPFFEIADSAERSRRADAPGPIPLPAPQLAPSIARPVSAVMPTAARGVFLQPAEHTVTTILVRRRPWRTRLPVQLAIMAGVAGLVTFAGISLVQLFAHTEEPIPEEQPIAEVEKAAEEPPPVPEAPPAVTSASIEPLEPEVAPEPEGEEEMAKPSPVLSRRKARAAARAARHAKVTGRGKAAQARRASGGPSPQIAAAQGYAALNRRQFPQAIELFKQAIAGNPRNGTAQFGLAEAYRESGRKSAALRNYRRYLHMIPHGPDASSARLQIRLLEKKLK